LSFILALAGMAFLLLTIMYLLVDVANVWTGSPLIYVGMNPILVPVLRLLNLDRLSKVEENSFL
jgi:hypothetical protein